MTVEFSIIIAVYKREEEILELLKSLNKQTYKNFEVIIVDDGSPTPIQTKIDNSQYNFSILNLYQVNQGPATARNFGATKTKGKYLLFLDSDVIVPPEYLQTIVGYLNDNPIDFFGGPDKEHSDFSPWQKAVSFAMTSTLSTGGIRGKKKSFTRFQPRSFNMGVLKSAFLKVNGFSDLRVGEDPDLSIRLWKNGFKSALIQNAWVYHKRRTTWQSFKKQVYSFGVARPILNHRHPSYSKIGFWFPSLFVLYILSIPLSIILFNIVKLEWLTFIYILPLLGYSVAVLLSAYLKHKNLKTAFLSLIAVGIQLFNYGLGFLTAQIRLNLLKQNPKEAFPKHFK